MSDQSKPQPDPTNEKTSDQESEDLKDVPAVAGGDDNKEPEQGEGEPNSF